MRRSLLLALITISLAACVPVSGFDAPGQAVPPELRAAQANAEMTATTSARDAQATTDALRAAEVRQASELEIAVAMAPVTAQAALLELQITAGAATDTAAIKTATATAAQSTAVVQAARSAATSTAAVKIQDREDAIALGWAWFWGLTILGMLAVVTYIAYRLAKRWQDNLIEQDNARQAAERSRIEIERQRASVRVLGNGVVIWLGPNGPEIIQLPSTGKNKALSERTRQVLDQDGFTVEDDHKIEPEDVNALALELIGRGILAWGDYSLQVPGHRMMGWYPSTWQRVTRPLKERKILDTKGGDSTFLKEGGPYPNLKALHDALEKGDLLLDAPPLPYPVAGD